MNKKISLGLTAAIALTAVAVSVIATVFVTLFFYNRVVSDISDKSAMYASLARVDEIVRKNYYYASDDKKLSDSLVSGYINALGDGNEYMTAQEYEEYKRQISSDELADVSYEKIDSNAYIKFKSFYPSAAQSFKSALEKASSDSVTGLIIDLRDVSQGDSETAVKTADMIVPLGSDKEQALAYACDRNGEKVKIWSADSSDVSLNIVLLINGKTSGAAELFTAVLTGYGKAVTVGAKTAGNGLYSEIFELEDGGALKLSVAELVGYGGKVFNEVGITPDAEFSGTDEEFMQKGIQTLKGE